MAFPTGIMKRPQNECANQNNLYPMQSLSNCQRGCQDILQTTLLFALEMEAQKNWNSQHTILKEKNAIEGINLLDARLYYKAIITRLMVLVPQ